MKEYSVGEVVVLTTDNNEHKILAVVTRNDGVRYGFACDEGKRFTVKEVEEKYYTVIGDISNGALLRWTDDAYIQPNLLQQQEETIKKEIYGKRFDR